MCFSIKIIISVVIAAIYNSLTRFGWNQYIGIFTIESFNKLFFFF